MRVRREIPVIEYVEVYGQAVLYAMHRALLRM